MSRQEWENSVNPETHKIVRKLIWTNRGLNKFLRMQEEQGWLLVSVTPTKYFFEKSQGGNWIYTMDSKSLTNKRRKAANREKFEDGRIGPESTMTGRLPVYRMRRKRDGPLCVRWRTELLFIGERLL